MHAMAKSDQLSAKAPSAELLQSLEQFPDLPSPPHIATQIIELLKDPEADFKRLMDYLAQDPALVAKILKTANSAMYARRREVTNMAQALLTLGQAATTTLALSFSLIEGLEESSKDATNFNLDFYWRRSLLAGFAARSLGAACGNDRREELFLAGLLQDIGLMVLAMAKPETYNACADHMENHDALIQHEVELLGVDHAWIGAWLLERWDLPNLISHSVRHSHTITPMATGGENVDSDEAEAHAFFACVGLSGQIADVMLTSPDDAVLAELTLAVTGALGLEQNEVVALLDRIADQVPDIESQFGMSVLDADSTSDIVTRARTLLTDVSLKLLQEIADLKSHTSTLVEEKHRDVLTGLYNREKLDGELRDWVARADQHKFPVALAFMDLDGFKSVNDVHGHPAGDAILKSTAALLRNQVRDTDTLARYGGDEFVLLLGGERKVDSMIVCDRILSAFEGSTHACDGEVVDIHISIGLATLDMLDEKTPEALLKAADLALLRAKALGKARVVAFDEIVEGEDQATRSGQR